MLILTRNKGERIVIEYPNGDKVTLEMLKVRESSVALGAQAPIQVRILRDEIKE